jgi:hypothetical protein
MCSERRSARRRRGSAQAEPDFDREWTRSQRIRTTVTLSVVAVLGDTVPPPLYQQIASKAQRMRELGMSNRAVAHALGVDDKTVAKAVIW